MEGYASNQANRSFVTFFLLNARLLLSMRIKFFVKRFLTDGHVEQQKKKFQVDKWASKHARLLFTTSCSHPGINFLHRMLILWIRLIHMFVTTKKSGWVRCYCHVQSGFCPHTPLHLPLHYRIFHGCCSFPSEASPLFSALVRLLCPPLSGVVNMVNNQEESGDDYTWRGSQ